MTPFFVKDSEPYIQIRSGVFKTLSDYINQKPNTIYYSNLRFQPASLKDCLLYRPTYYFRSLCFTDCIKTSVYLPVLFNEKFDILLKATLKDNDIHINYVCNIISNNKYYEQVLQLQINQEQIEQRYLKCLETYYNSANYTLTKPSYIYVKRKILPLEAS